MTAFVRTAGIQDLPAIQRFLQESWHATFDALLGVEAVDEITAKWHSQPALKAMLARDRSEYLVADDGKRLCGVAYAAAVGEEDARIVKLHQLYVAPDMQGRGIGGMLLHEIEDSFFESERLRLEVMEINARAIAFYEAEGFALVGREQWGEPAQHTVLIYEKSLI